MSEFRRGLGEIWNAGGFIFGYNEIDTTMEMDRKSV